MISVSEIEEFAEAAIGMMNSGTKGQQANRLIVASLFGAAAYDKAIDGDAAPFAMLQALLLAMKDPAHPDLDYLRAGQTKKVSAE